MSFDHSVLDVDPSEDRDGYLIARNMVVTDARLRRLAEDYAEATTDLPQVRAWINRWCTDYRTAPWLYLYGQVGTGKTWAAIAALREAVKVPRSVVWEFVTFSAMLESRRSGPEHVESRVYERADLLVIDDLGMVKDSSDWAIEELYRVIDSRRRNGRCTVLTANVRPKDLSAEVGEQTMSRIAQACIVVSMVGDDRRRTSRPAPPAAPAPPEPDPTVRDRSAEVDALLAQLRTEIPPGDPGKLRYATKEWSRIKRQRERTDDKPNPLYRARVVRPVESE